MRRPGRALAWSLPALAFGIAFFTAAVLELTGPEDSWPTTISGVAGLFLSFAAVWFVLAAALEVVGSRRLMGGKGVIASWQVAPDVWQKFLDIDLPDTGVSLPFLESLAFYTRKSVPTEPVEVICGRKGALMDGCYFALSPARGAGLEEAGMTNTDPPCLALVLRSHFAGSGAMRIIRTLLLLPVPPGAHVEAHRALRHYLEAIEGIRGFDSVVAANFGIARVVFWLALALSLVAALLGIYLETIEYPGLWPDAMAITGILMVPVTLLLGWLWRPTGGRR